MRTQREAEFTMVTPQSPRSLVNRVLRMDEDKRNPYRMLAVLSTVGLTIVIAIMIGLYLGFQLDTLLGTSPWFTALFFLLGVFAGFRNLFKYAKRSFDKDEVKKP